MDKKESKISNVEWGLYIGALIMVDIVQAGLEWLLIGLVVNPFIDVFVGMGKTFYLYIRGENIKDSKRLLALGASFIGELLPVVDELPLWTFDGVYDMLLSKSNAILKETVGQTPVVNNVAKLNQKSNPSISQNNPINKNNNDLGKAA
jgi:hypothetical protein